MNIDMFDNSKKKVLLRGPFLTQSGYGVHARQIASWAFSRKDFDIDVQALPWGDTPWIIDGNYCNGLVDKIMQKTSDPSGKKYDVSIQLQLPNEWDPTLAKKNIGVTASVETDKCNPEWVKSCNKMDHVVFPSNHAKNSITNTGNVTTKVSVIPESFSDDFLPENQKQTNVTKLNWSTKFNFLLVGQITGNNPESDRKNIFYTVKWFCETFKDDPDVGLVIKTNVGRNTTIDRKITENLFTSLLKEVRVNANPKIHLLHGHMTDAEMASLYRHPQINALLALTRGEGFGLPILEAAVCGLPVIATSWSGHVDFLSLGKYIEIPYNLAQIDKSRVDDNIFHPHSKWANPIEDEVKKKLIKFKLQNSIPKEWAYDLSKKLIKDYCESQIIKKYDSLFEEFIKC